MNIASHDTRVRASSRTIYRVLPSSAHICTHVRRENAQGRTPCITEDSEPPERDGAMAATDSSLGLCRKAGPTERGVGAREEWLIFGDARRSVGILHPPTPVSVSPALFHGESGPEKQNK